jgi:hypothetical protein
MGQVGAALTNPNTFAPQPSGFNGTEMATRGIGDTALGLGKGLANYGQQQQKIQQNAQGSPQINPMQFVPQLQQPSYIPKGNNLAFYGNGQ